MAKKERQKLFLKAVEGRRVRDPKPPYKLLDEEGEWKPDNAHWRRQLELHGDVVEATPPSEHAPHKGKAKQETSNAAAAGKD